LLFLLGDPASLFDNRALLIVMKRGDVDIGRRGWGFPDLSDDSHLELLTDTQNGLAV
jgi:hypothetical protein